MSARKVKAKNAKEFDAACANGCVYGKLLSSRPVFFVYVDLGREGEYENKAGDDKKTEYKIFFNCDISFAETQEDLKNGNYCQELLDQTVIVSL